VEPVQSGQETRGRVPQDEVVVSNEARERQARDRGRAAPQEAREAAPRVRTSEADDRARRQEFLQQQRETERRRQAYFAQRQSEELARRARSAAAAASRDAQRRNGNDPVTDVLRVSSRQTAQGTSEFPAHVDVRV
jgi:hypothetical protein